MKIKLLASVLVVMMVIPAVQAIDRDARLIERVGFIGGNYDHGDSEGWEILSEILLAAENESWALIAGVWFEDTTFDSGEDVDSWTGALGIKYYLTEVTAISILASHEEFNYGANSDISAGTLGVKQRLAPADWAISPYLLYSASLQSIDVSVGFRGDEDDSYSALAITAGVGCDFMANDNFAFVFEGTYSESESLTSHGSDFADGVTAAIYMTYYWDSVP